MKETDPPFRSGAPLFAEIVHARLTRRALLKGGAMAAIALAPLPKGLALAGSEKQVSNRGTSFDFQEIARGVDETHHVAPGYRANILIRWGDPVLPGAPPFDPYHQTAAAQALQFGYNNDYIGYFPLSPKPGDLPRGILCVNHEYTNEELMFPGIGRQDTADFADMTLEMVKIEMAAHGGSILEIGQVDGRWEVVPDSPYARRITAHHTWMKISGPAAGHRRMRTGYDPSGREIIGTVNNCAGGITPWGTYLMAEENFDDYFWGDLDGHPEQRNYARYKIPGKVFAWGKFFHRWDINKEPNEANRFGWVVEVDPFNRSMPPIKRTALGRFKHEGAECIVNKDGRVVVYMGDDEAFEYVYRFVSRKRYQPERGAANRRLLDDGILSVARFEADGTLTWIPLVFGRHGLTRDNGFDSQADVLIETRRAADIVGATPMDRPEDVQPNPQTNKVYVCLTNNIQRLPHQLDAVNSRAFNLWGQIVELIPPEGDHGAGMYRWELLVKCGDPTDPKVAAMWNTNISRNGWSACPDNCTMDHAGRLWVATDQGGAWAKTSGGADGLWALEAEGDSRGVGRMFFRVPKGAELCGPTFTPDDRTLFVSVQHPAADDFWGSLGFGRASTFDHPSTRWPDFDEKIPPRPAVVAITKVGGGKIGRD